jgi:DNA-binding XRE family transcriptional regulator
MNFSRRFQEVRKALNKGLPMAQRITTEKLMADLGISKQTIYNWESDDYQPVGRADVREGMAKYADYLHDAAIRRGRPDLALSRAEFAPDVLGEPEPVRRVG